VIVTSLYSFPFNVLKSSATAADKNENIEKVSTFVLIVELMGALLLLIFCLCQVKENSQARFASLCDVVIEQRETSLV
jgi:hypothetical protein